MVMISSCDDFKLCGGNWKDDVKIRNEMKWLRVHGDKSKGESRVYYKTVDKGTEIFGSRSLQSEAPQQRAEHESFKSVIEYSVVD